VAPKPIRTLRNLTRYRKRLVRDRQREANRLHKATHGSPPGVELDAVATDLLGKCARAMLDALVSGRTDPDVLAELALGRLRVKIPALREALAGRFSGEHVLVVGQILAHLDSLDESIQTTAGAIEREILPLASEVKLLQTIPGSGSARPR
jgi:hypothetical protein